MTDIPENLWKKIAFAISDPGHAGEGYKGDRTLTEWQTDAVMTVVENAIEAAVKAEHEANNETIRKCWGAGYGLEIMRKAAELATAKREF